MEATHQGVEANLEAHQEVEAILEALQQGRRKERRRLGSLRNNLAKPYTRSLYINTIMVGFEVRGAFGQKWCDLENAMPSSTLVTQSKLGNGILLRQRGI